MSKIPAEKIDLRNFLNMPDKKAKQLSNKGICTVADLLNFLPRRYEDRSKLLQPKMIMNYVGQKVSFIGQIEEIKVDPYKQYMVLDVYIGEGINVAVKWFHQNYLATQFNEGETYFFYGKLEYSDSFGFGMTSPGYFSKNLEESKSPLPIYSKIPGMSDEYLHNAIMKCLHELGKGIEMSDIIDEEMRERLGVDGIAEFMNKAHNPKSMEDLKQISRRIATEKLIPFAWAMLQRKYDNRTETDKVVNKAKSVIERQTFEARLPFNLTEDQALTITEMVNTITSGRRLDALIQGDVGCGKTVVAIEMAYVMGKSGYQTAVMAPTAILAEQHYNEFDKELAPLGLSVGFLEGKMKAKEKKEMYAKVKSGEINVIIGTQAVISKDVEFQSLGLTIVDEEHRFGVMQREELRKKAAEGAHAISMSATPIPRSIALAIYGECTTIYNIKTMPSGRKPVSTIAFSNEIKTYEATYRQIKKGRQAYIICPMITASDAMDGVDSVEETLEKCKKFFEKYPEVKISCINGKMKTEDVKETVRQFAEGEIDILISTTIVEVGVNVPNATVMVIKNAERFGLAQLHQLRGRVGRGTEQAYCVLLCEDKTNPRVQALVNTSDGYEIAKEDLQMRGAGNLVGTEQSGFDTAVNMMAQMPELYAEITRELDKIFKWKQRYDAYSKLTA